MVENRKNAGINTAGRVIAVVTGMRSEKFTNARLFEALVNQDTILWSSGRQVQRLAKSCKPKREKNDLEKTTVTQRRPPLSDRGNRYPMSADRLISTVSDTVKFCQMILHGDVFNGRRLVSEVPDQSLNYPGPAGRDYRLRSLPA